VVSSNRERALKLGSGTGSVVACALDGLVRPGVNLVPGFGFGFPGFWFRDSFFGFQVSGFGFWVSGCVLRFSFFRGFRVSCLVFCVSDSWSRVPGFGSWVLSLQFRVSGVGFPSSASVGLADYS